MPHSPAVMSHSPVVPPVMSDSRTLNVPSHDKVTNPHRLLGGVLGGVVGEVGSALGDHYRGPYGCRRAPIATGGPNSCRRAPIATGGPNSRRRAPIATGGPNSHRRAPIATGGPHMAAGGPQ
ncbi:unnamed protein product [Arctogadus glacialis]